MTILRDGVVFFLVTCSREKSRADALRKTITSLLAEHEKTGICKHLVVFDNASTFKEPLMDLPESVPIALCSGNIGYWGALSWLAEHIGSIHPHEYQFVHPLESDLILYETQRLNNAIAFLERCPEFSSVRTQEFNARFPWRYFKDYLPSFLINHRSSVSRFHTITGEKTTFSRYDGIQGMYTANWHIKVPALHRLPVLRTALAHLASQPHFTEKDFMAFMHEASPCGIGVLDKGIYYAQEEHNTVKGSAVSGSYTSPEELAAQGYLATRTASIPERLPEVSVVTPSEIGKN